MICCFHKVYSNINHRSQLHFQLWELLRVSSSLPWVAGPISSFLWRKGSTSPNWYITSQPPPGFGVCSHSLTCSFLPQSLDLGTMEKRRAIQRVKKTLKVGALNLNFPNRIEHMTKAPYAQQIRVHDSDNTHSSSFTSSLWDSTLSVTESTLMRCATSSPLMLFIKNSRQTRPVEWSRYWWNILPQQEPHQDMMCHQILVMSTLYPSMSALKWLCSFWRK